MRIFVILAVIGAVWVLCVAVRVLEASSVSRKERERLAVLEADEIRRRQVRGSTFWTPPIHRTVVDEPLTCEDARGWLKWLKRERRGRGQQSACWRWLRRHPPAKFSERAEPMFEGKAGHGR